MRCPLRLLPFALAVIVACTVDSGGLPSAPRAGISAMAFSADRSPWSEPVHLGPPVNSPFRELAASLSSDELSLYFGSDRPGPGALGAFDIWVSHRACLECPWEEAVNLGPNINSAGGDGAPALSHDGHLLFFSGSRAGEGGEDIWVSHRTDSNDDLGWEPAVNLGPDVNTAANEGGPAYVRALNGGGATLYFDRGASLAGTDIYEVHVTGDGETLGAAVPVAELNSSNLDGRPTVRADGREVFFWSTRLGATDIWVATRRSPHDPWSPPENLGAPVNTPFGELTPSLSWDGRTLIFSGTFTRGSSLGFQDFWMSTRTPSGH